MPDSYRHSTTPASGSRSLSRLFTRPIVLSSFDRPCKREKVRLQRQEHIIHRGQRVDREDAERRRAVDEDVVEIVRRLRPACRAESLRGRRRRPARLRRRRGRCATRRPTGSLQARRGRALPEVGDRRFLGEQVVHRRHVRACGSRPRCSEACACGSISMRPTRWPARASAALEVHGGRRFADAAFLIDDGDAAHGRGRGSGARGLGRALIERRIIGDWPRALRASCGGVLAVLSRRGLRVSDAAFAPTNSANISRRPAAIGCVETVAACCRPSRARTIATSLQSAEYNSCATAVDRRNV